MSEASRPPVSVQEASGLYMPSAPTGDLPDINVWLALAVQEHPHHALARQYWETAVRSARPVPGPCLWFCRTTMLGLVRLLCQPKAVGAGALELGAAWGLYQRFRALPQVGLLVDPAACDTHLGALLASAHPPAKLWTDAYLGALARASMLRLVTFDRDFARFGLPNCLVLPRA